MTAIALSVIDVFFKTFLKKQPGSVARVHWSKALWAFDGFGSWYGKQNSVVCVRQKVNKILWWSFLALRVYEQQSFTICHTHPHIALINKSGVQVKILISNALIYKILMWVPVPVDRSLKCQRSVWTLHITELRFVNLIWFTHSGFCPAALYP